MDHLVCLDGEEFERLASGVSTMLVRGSAEKRPPHGRVGEGDTLHFLLDDGDGTVRARATVKKATSTPMLDPEASTIRLIQNQRKLMLTERQAQRWAGRRYLVFVEVERFEEVGPFAVDPSLRPGPEGWVTVENVPSARER
jgi:hypothetical protein